MAFSLTKQFTIRTLFLSVAAIGVLLTVGKVIGAIWSAIVLWIAAMVAAHVAGAIIGHRRRASQVRRSADFQMPSPAAFKIPAAPEQLVGVKPLSPWVRHLTGAGALAGLFGGLTAMWILTDHSLKTLLLGGISAACLGGFFAFLAASFLAIAMNAFQEASAAEPFPSQFTPAPRADIKQPSQNA